MNIENKEQALQLLEVLEKRRKDYWLLSTKLQEHQQQVLPYIKEKVERDWKLVPEKKWILFQWGNRSGKTFLLMYICTILAMGELVYNYKDNKWNARLPYLGSKKNIWIVTKSGANVETTIIPYLFGDGSGAKIPPECIKHIKNNNGRPEKITLVNGSVIRILTYDQGRERLQGWTPDFIAVDEEPTDEEVWTEIMVRLSGFQAQMMLSMTPLSWFTPVYQFFYEQELEEGQEDRRQVFLVNSLQNEHWDHSWLLMLSEEERKSRLYWQFVPTTWLVFYEFNRTKHVVPHFHPEKLWYWTRYYAGLDFWVNHPTAFWLVAVDTDGNSYIFDGFCKSNMLLSEMASEIKRLKRFYWIELEYIVADSAAKRERTELKRLWITTVWADKWSKGENGESNRKASILKVNQMLHNGKLYISDKLKKTLIKEFETHCYKDWGKDWDVIKENDDFVDAIRYVLWSLKQNKVKTKRQEQFEKKWWTPHSSSWYYKNNYKQPY